MYYFLDRFVRATLISLKILRLLVPAGQRNAEHKKHISRNTRLCTRFCVRASLKKMFSSPLLYQRKIKSSIPSDLTATIAFLSERLQINRWKHLLCTARQIFPQQSSLETKKFFRFWGIFMSLRNARVKLAWFIRILSRNTFPFPFF